MCSSLFRCACTALCLVLPSPTSAQLPGDSASLARITQRLMDAITDGDSTVWGRQLSLRWFITDEEGRHLTRAEFLAELRGLPPGQSGRLEIKDVHFRSAPGVVVLSYDIDEWHNYHEQELRTRFHSTDTWIREGQSWKMLAAQVTALPTPIAGRTIPRATLEEYVGTYALTDDIGLRITLSDSGLALVRVGRPAQRLYAIDDRVFIRHGARGFWLFERDSTGTVSQLVSWRDNNPVHWRRVREH